MKSDTGQGENIKYEKGRGKKREKDSSISRTWERLTLKHPSAGQTGSVCNSRSTKTHSVYLGQQEEGTGEERSKSQHWPSSTVQLCTELYCTLLLLQLSLCKISLFSYPPSSSKIPLLFSFQASLTKLCFAVTTQSCT